MPGSALALERDALVAVMLAGPEEWAAMRELYEPRLFRAPQHRAAAEAIGSLRTNGSPVEPRAVTAALERAGNVAAARTFQTILRRGRAVGDGVAVLRMLTAEAQRARAGILDAAAIFAPLPPVRWLCQALDLAPGAPALFAGYGYSGKTVSAQEFALAVASGTKAWGRFDVRKGRVLHIDYEQGSYLTRARYQRLARARSLTQADLAGRLEVEALPPWYLDGADAYDQLAQRCEGVDLVIIDSYRAACPRTEENSSDARVPLDVLGRVSETTGTLPVVLHHARKPTKDAQGGARMTVRGSGALYDACGAVLVFAGEKGRPVTVSHEKARITGRPIPDFGLWIEDVEVDGDPTGGLRVSVVDAPGNAHRKTPSDRFDDLKKKILALVTETGSLRGGVNAIRVRVGSRKDDVVAALDELLVEGAIERAGSYRRPVYVPPGMGAHWTETLGTDGDSP